jgi:hypothetical protein
LLSKDYGTIAQNFVKKIYSLAGEVYLVNKISQDSQGLLFIFGAEGEKN